MYLDYLNPYSRQTLGSALAELREAEGAENDAAGQVAPELSRDLDVHDAIHVIFACSTDVEGEVMAHAWTLLGTTAKIGDLHRVMSHRDHREALAKIGHRHLLSMWVWSVPRIALTVWRALRMTGRLRIEALPGLLAQPLAEIRRDHGIRLSRPRRMEGPLAGAAVRNLRRTPVSSSS